MSTLVGLATLLAIGVEIIYGLRHGEWLYLTPQTFFPLEWPLQPYGWSGVNKIINAVFRFLWAIPLWV